MIIMLSFFYAPNFLKLSRIPLFFVSISFVIKSNCESKDLCSSEVLNVSNDVIQQFKQF
jgi:hypothetical protein